MIFQASMVGVSAAEPICAIITRIVLQQHTVFTLPKTQGELIRRARGTLTQTEFARKLGVERSCLSRYEREKLGAPVKVLNHCLGAIEAQMRTSLASFQGIEQALLHARQTVSLLEVSSRKEPSSAP